MDNAKRSFLKRTGSLLLGFSIYNVFAEDVKYTCPMHPQIIRDKPGQCPICGMNLVKKELSFVTNDSIDVNVTGSLQQSLAIKHIIAEKSTLWQMSTIVGNTAFDDKSTEHVHPRASGWIEKFPIQSVGDPIEKGQILYEIYSQELVTAQTDFLLTTSQVKDNNSTLLKNSKIRMKLLGFTENQINDLAKTRKVSYTVPVYANQSGVVKELNVREGMYVTPVTEIMSITNLDKIWVIADVVGQAQNWIKKGTSATVLMPDGVTWASGSVDYVYPELNMKTRSLSIRIVLENSNLNLKPNFVTKVMLVGSPKHDVIAIPQEALIQTENSNRVVVQKDDNSFNIKQVTVGLKNKDKVEIIKGLDIGDKVIVSGQFLIDSEASLKQSFLRVEK